MIHKGWNWKQKLMHSMGYLGKRQAPLPVAGGLFNPATKDGPVLRPAKVKHAAPSTISSSRCPNLNRSSEYTKTARAS